MLIRAMADLPGTVPDAHCVPHAPPVGKPGKVSVKPKPSAHNNSAVPWSYSPADSNPDDSMRSFSMR
jgi:hypothetical protein